MTFGAPQWLWALMAVPVLVYFFIANELRRKSLLGKIVAPRLQARLAGSVSIVKRRLRFATQLLGLAAVAVSLARPQIGYTWEQSKRTGREVMIAIDTSRSMLSTDVAPNRLTRAKFAAQDLVQQLKGDRAGVLAFAGSAFLQAPLTVDYMAVSDALNDLDTNTIPIGGTNIASVIDEAARAFGKGESENRCLVLFTDGEDLDGDSLAAAQRQANNFRIFTVGVGTPEGSIIPIAVSDGGTEFVKDPEGQIVKSRLDENRLKEIAEVTGGFYTHLENGPADTRRIVEEGLGSVKERDIDVRLSRHPIERYQWPLGLGILLLAASMLVSEKRRAPVSSKVGKVIRGAATVLLLLWLGVRSAGAVAPAPPNEGIELYNNQKYRESYDSFNGQLKRNPDSQALEFDSGAAAYKAGDYNKAIDAFGRAIASPSLNVRGKSEYNLGNSLCLRGFKQQSGDAKLKDWNNAIQHYDEALKIDPNNEDAKYNRDVVKKLIEELKKKQQQSQQSQSKDQKQDKDKKQDQKNQQNQQNQQKDQNKQDQKDQKQNQNDSGNGQDQQEQQQQPQNSQGSNNQNKQDSKDQNGSQNNQSQQGSKQGDKQDSNSGQDQQSKGQDQQPGQQNPSQDNANNPPQDTGHGSQHPTPGDGEPEKKYSGQIQEDQQQKQDSQAAAREQPYAPGQEREMTPAEAARIVESEKGEEAKGVLIEHKGSAAVLKDW
jgi:Ca-activated chloride channel family protein